MSEYDDSTVVVSCIVSTRDVINDAGISLDEETDNFISDYAISTVNGDVSIEDVIEKASDQTIRDILVKQERLDVYSVDMKDCISRTDDEEFTQYLYDYMEINKSRVFSKEELKNRLSEIIDNNYDLISKA
jgi:hypothetical protein